MNYQLIFRSKYGQFSAATVLCLSTFFLTMIWRADGPLEALRAVVLPVGLTYFTWWIWAWPKLVANKRGITVYNLLRTYRISWNDFVDAQSHFGLYLSVRQKGVFQENESEEVESANRIFVAGVPARGGFAASRIPKSFDVPSLNFSKGPNLVLRVEPNCAAQLLEQEKTYFDTPSERPTIEFANDTNNIWSLRNKPDAAHPYLGVSFTVNWTQISLMILCVMGVAAYGFSLQ